jgi:O-antigen ligase
MTTTSLRRALPAPVSQVVIVAFSLAAAVVVGAAMTFNPAAGLVLLITAVCVPLVMIDPPVGIALCVAATFLTRFAPLAPLLGAVLVALAALGDFQRERLNSDAHGRLLVCVGLLLVWLTLSLGWAHDAGRARHALVDWYRMGVVLVAIAIIVRTPRDVRVVLYGFVLGAVLSVVVGIVHDGLGGGSSVAATAALTDSERAQLAGRLVGGVGDPNFLASGTVAALVLATALAAAGHLTRAMMAVVVGVLVVGLVATQSRGGFVAGLVALVAALAFMPSRRAKVALAAVAVAGLTGAYVMVSPAALERVQSADREGGGRTELWSVAWRMSEDHPLAGVGLANFRVQAPSYVYRPGALRFADIIADRPHAAHNTYLEVLAESGVVGLALFLGAMATGLASAAAAARRFRHLGQRRVASLAECVLVASIATLTASMFVSNGPEPRLWILLSLGVALLSIARRAEPRGAVR